VTRPATRLDRLCVALARATLVAGVGLMLLADVFYCAALRIRE